VQEVERLLRKSKRNSDAETSSENLLKSKRWLKHNLKQYRSPSVPAIRSEPKVQNNQRVPINSYAALQFSKNKYVTDPEYNKLTLKKIESIAGPDTKGLDGDFNPHDLIDDNDDEDDIYLAQYSIQPEKLRRQQQEINAKKQLEEYGIMAKPSPVKALDRSYLGQNQSRTENNMLGRRNTDAPSPNMKNGDSPTKEYRSMKVSGILSSQPGMYGGVSKSQDMKAMPRGNNVSQYYDRANEVENQAKKKESEHLSHLINVHDAYLKKGMIVVAK